VLARRLAEQRFGAMEGDLQLDVSALRDGSRKLGLGSSAAAAAATVGAVVARAGKSLDDASIRSAVLDVALEGHRAVAPAGSGADVAASVLGGLFVFQREEARVDVQPVAPPATLDVRVIWTGVEARTSELVERVAQLRGRDEGAHDAAIARLSAAATRVCLAFAKDDPAEAIAAFAEHHEALAELGRLADVPIVEAKLAEAARLARAHGGAAKPSGAGGGDIAVAVFDRREKGAADAYEEACRQAGMAPVVVPLHAVGLRTEPLEGTTS